MSIYIYIYINIYMTVIPHKIGKSDRFFARQETRDERHDTARTTQEKSIHKTRQGTSRRHK